MSWCDDRVVIPFSRELVWVCQCVCVFLCVSTLVIHFLLRHINLKQGHSAFLPQSFPFIGLLFFYHPLITNLHTGPFLVCCFSLSLQILLSLPVRASARQKIIFPNKFPLLCTLSVLHGWMERWTGDGWMAGWSDRPEKTERNLTPGRSVDWYTCWWKLKKDMTWELLEEITPLF